MLLNGLTEVLSHGDSFSDSSERYCSKVVREVPGYIEAFAQKPDSPNIYF